MTCKACVAVRKRPPAHPNRLCEECSRAARVRRVARWYESKGRVTQARYRKTARGRAIAKQSKARYDEKRKRQRAAERVKKIMKPCADCSAPIVVTIAHRRRRCEECRRAAKAQVEARYHNTTPGRICRARAQAAQTERRRDTRTAGECVGCGEVITPGRQKTCEKCRVLRRKTTLLQHSKTPARRDSFVRYRRSAKGLESKARWQYVASKTKNKELGSVWLSVRTIRSLIKFASKGVKL